MAGICEWVDVGGGLRGYYGKPEGPGPHPCVVVYIEAFGVNDHFQKLEHGYRLPRPSSMPVEIYQILLETWHKENKMRPGFHKLSKIFE
ncbi:MAG: protein kinase, partial [Pseudomonadota bacterium]|nr:protein kinase [Pseudomonadota bacterium]